MLWATFSSEKDLGISSTTSTQYAPEQATEFGDRAGFSLSRALFRKKCGGPSVIYEYRPTEFTQ